MYLSVAESSKEAVGETRNESACGSRSPAVVESRTSVALDCDLVVGVMHDER